MEHSQSPYHVLIRDLPVTERPRERLRDHGPSALSTAELLAILLRTGTKAESVLNLAHRLLAKYGGLAGLVRASFAELCAEHGMGQAKAAQLKAALELGQRLRALSPEERPTISSPEDVKNLLIGEMGFLEQEHLRVLLLNTRNQVLGTHEVYKGSLHTALIRVGEVLREAVRQNCAAIIVVHNHPSGDPTPSAEDVRVTEEIVKAGQLLDIEVLDHVVIGQQGYVSLKEHGLGFKG